MCGRYKLVAPTGRVFDEFELVGTRLNLQPRYNMAPTQEAPVVRRMPSGRQISLIRWGLIPGWSAPQRPGVPVGTGQINARAETVAEKPTFRDAMKQRRCLVVADGFYEWRQDGREKRPMLFEKADGGLMAFAGLWERWEGLESFAIICTNANTLVGTIHDRMPVILAKDHWDAWLDTDRNSVASVLPLLTSYPADTMTMRPVSPRLNKTSAEDDASLLTPEPPVQGSLF
ncbi:MAG: SOS response-associated peptidase [Proteobacteria bacterium]|nr:SOS response-associated peptidase [Pseudomonadota bacterium]